MTSRVRIGCPVWACAEWRGRLYTRDAERKDYLTQYAQVFATVEGNSTFYALPSEAAVLRWREETPEDFRFCFKFPSEITHRLMLRHAQSATTNFLRLMAPLAERLGPFMIQLGPRFGAAYLDVLRSFLRALPGDFQYAVEVRHGDFFDQGPNEAALHDLLRERGVDRCIFDTRCVHAGADRDDSTLAAQARKPLLPLRTPGPDWRPIVRFVGQNSVAPAESYLDVWIDILAQCVNSGRQAYFFAHTPNDRMAPELARRLHQRLGQSAPQLGSLPSFNGEREAPLAAAQLSLF